MKNLLSVPVCLVAMLVFPLSSHAQAQSVLNSPTKSEMESVVKGMGLSMSQKFSLRSILQGMREQGEKVLANGSLSNDQKAAQIVKVRQGALGQTQSILSAPQQQQLTALLLPKQ